MNNLQIFFSDYFEVDEDVVETYGAVNISLLNDMPLFIDPFLLFNSEKAEYQAIHSNIIKYLLFLQEQANAYPTPPAGMLESWFAFSEVKQTWLGFSLSGNAGRGLGRDFAMNLYKGLRTIFKDFGKEKLTKSSHLEKLCLISPLVGRDKISDLTTNFSKLYLLQYTENFAKSYLKEEKCHVFYVPRVSFNYITGTWMSGSFYLPCYQEDFVLLTPRDILTRDDTFINRTDMISNLQYLVPAVDDAVLRFSLNQYLTEILPRKKKEMSKSEKDKAASLLVSDHPEIIDYYIKYKEENEAEATSISKQVVQEVKQLFNLQLKELANLLHEKTPFYDIHPTAHDEARERVLYLKKVIEDMDGYRIFYLKGKPIKRENDLQIMYRLVWYATEFDVNREVNNGRGPVDYKISKGAWNSSLVEFKLASNSKLKKNLANQVEIYKKANRTAESIKVILFFSDEEYETVSRILSELELSEDPDIILIDARPNKPSASIA